MFARIARFSWMPILLAATVVAHAQTAAPAPSTPPPELEARLAAILPPGMKPESIRPAGIPGLFEVVVGDHLFYAAMDGARLYVGSGDLIDTAKGVNLADARRTELEIRRGKRALAAIDALGEDKMIIFSGDKPRRTLTVFTDVDCPYCARFHRGVPELVAAGVKVRYLLFPRNGLKSATYARSVAVWCAADRRAALTTAKSGGKLELKTCPNPVAQHYKLGEEAGVTGTPTLITDAGQIIPGALPPKQLLAMLGLAPPETAKTK